MLALHDWIEIAGILRVRDLFRLTGLPVGQLPDEPSEHESVAPIRDALHAYLPSLDEPVELPLLWATVQFAWDTWHSSPNRFSRTAPLLPELICQVRTAAETAAEPERREAHRLLTTMYMLVRAYCKRVGAQDLSHLAADRAMAAARITGDPGCIGAASWNIMAVLSTQGHAEAAVRLARDAIADLNRVDEPTPEQLAVLGSLYLLLAVQEARLRNEHNSLNALDTAERAASVTGENNAHRLIFGPTNVSMHRAAVSLDLSRASEARRAAERLDVSHLPSVERRFTHYLDLAKGFAFGREDLSSLHMLKRAEDECPEEAKLHLLFRAIVRDLLTRETPTLRPELRPLAERVGVV